MRKERFPSKCKTKLMPRADGPLKVLERVNDNAYKINLPKYYGVSAIFNMADLSLFLEDEHLSNLRENSPQQGEDDEGSSMEPSLNPQASHGSSNSNFKVKEKVLALLDHISVLPR